MSDKVEQVEQMNRANQGGEVKRNFWQKLWRMIWYRQMWDSPNNNEGR